MSGNWFLNCVAGNLQRFLSTISVLTLVAMTTPAARADFFAPWTTTGSAGTVDAARAAVVYTRDFADISPAAALPAFAMIRYNVTAVDGLLVKGNGYFLRARFADSGTTTRVTLRLLECNITIASPCVVRMSLDSNAFPAAVLTQVQSVSVCGPSWSFDFANKTYHVEAVLTKSAAGASPRLVGIQIGVTNC